MRLPAYFLLASLCITRLLYAASDELVVKIGLAGALSGPLAHLGKDNENGAKMAIDTLNETPYLIGKQRAKFVLLSEDDEADPERGTSIAQKLVDANVNVVIGHLTSSTSIPASKIYYEAGIPQLAPSVTSLSYNAQAYPSTFRVVANDGQLGAVLGRYAVTQLGAKTIAVIDDRTALGQGLADQFIKSVKSVKSTTHFVPRQFTSDKATDFSAILTTIKTAKPDLIFFGGFDRIGGPMLRQIKGLNMHVQFMGGDGICTEEFAPLAGDALEDNKVFCATAGGIPDGQKNAIDAFNVRYQAKFHMPQQVYAPYVYDAIMAVAQAMQTAKSAKPDVYLPFLRKIEYKGVTGLIAFDAVGNTREAYVTLFTYRGAKRVALSVVH